MKIAPSLYNAPLMRLEQILQTLEDEGIEILHVDVMDGHFVPALSFGEKIVDQIHSDSPLYLDVHLMVDKPEQFLARFQNADGITIHAEATAHPAYCLDAIHRMGKDAGLALNPGTPVSLVEDLLPLCDRVLVMTVNPGRGGEMFREEMNQKILKLKDIRSQKQLSFEIQADGNITEQTIQKLDADCAVSGGFLFQSPDLAGNIRRLNANAHN